MFPLRTAHTQLGSEATQVHAPCDAGHLSLRSPLSSSPSCVQRPPKSRLTASLQSSCAAGPAMHEMDELRAILQNSPPASSYLGMSPPVRSGYSGGAANPLAHDHNWMGSAYNASHTNLQALKELDPSGLHFLSSQLSSPRSVEGGFWIDQVKAARLGNGMACRPQSQAVQMHIAEHGSCGM